MDKICIACKKQFSTSNHENRLCGVCSDLVATPLDLDSIRSNRKKRDEMKLFVERVSKRMTEIIANPGNAEFVNQRAAIVRQEAEDLLGE